MFFNLPLFEKFYRNFVCHMKMKLAEKLMDYELVVDLSYGFLTVFYLNHFYVFVYSQAFRVFAFSFNFGLRSFFVSAKIIRCFGWYFS